jgi:hypothetical protein
MAQLVNFHKSDVFGGLAAHAGARNDGRILAQLRRPFDAGFGHRLARRDHGELREAVHEIGAPVLEIGFVSIAAHLRSVLKPQAGAVH